MDHDLGLSGDTPAGVCWPAVATFLPATLDWARRLGISPSKLLLPLSYAAILGGTCTLIGTSTNLIVNGLLIAESGRGLG